ncbi:hypothetical protein [Derxia lacustris]|uniref:hypothetical protein n=1 Tax=Derxia lacustris TaxID=764842 RepID=UPI000A16DABF|nr:hypothetical protein [Derxia lacustris]
MRARPAQLATDIPPTGEEPFSAPRSWHCVSDALHAFAPDHLDALLSGNRARTPRCAAAKA